jgi:hypothetical protein
MDVPWIAPRQSRLAGRGGWSRSRDPATYPVCHLLNRLNGDWHTGAMEPRVDAMRLVDLAPRLLFTRHGVLASIATTTSPWRGQRRELTSKRFWRRIVALGLQDNDDNRPLRLRRRPAWMTVLTVIRPGGTNARTSLRSRRPRRKAERFREVDGPSHRVLRLQYRAVTTYKRRRPAAQHGGSPGVGRVAVQTRAPRENGSLCGWSGGMVNARAVPGDVRRACIPSRQTCKRVAFLVRCASRLFLRPTRQP